MARMLAFSRKPTPEPDVELPLVAIVGAPNVGKSTLFNRLVGGRRAIVTDEPGVTRDRLFGEVTDVEHPFRLVDTGGLTPNVDAPFSSEIENQAVQAIDAAALVLFVLDTRAGVTAQDLEITGWLRRRGLRPIVVGNKVDGPRQEEILGELHEIGMGEPVGVSAEHGRGADELMDRIAAALADLPPDARGEYTPPEAALRIAIVGRPNVGKSSLLNRLVGEERVVVSEIPGTTRDATDTLLEIDSRRYRLIDTAGIRRRGRVERGVERFSVARAKQNIEHCDVAVLVLDGSQPFAAQDAHIAGFIGDSYKPMVIAVNKWDLVEGREEQAKRWQDEVHRRLAFAKQAPMILISALTGQRTRRVLDEVDRLHAIGGRQVTTSEFNRWLQEAAGLQKSAPAHGRSLRVYYGTQTGVHPPRFLLFCNDPKRAHFSVRRYLENNLRERFGLGGVPLRLSLRARREETED